MTKTITKYGIFGVAAIAAILSISLIATAMNAPIAQADGANKVGWVEHNTEVMAKWTESDHGESEQTFDVELGPYEIHTSDKNDWLVTLWAECATTSEVQATGGKGKKQDSAETSGATAGATATLYYGDEATDEYKEVKPSWRICQQDLQIEADLNALIEFVPGLNCDTDADPDCGSLQFVCDFEDPDADPEVLASEACQQWVKIYSEVAGSYSAAWIIPNMDAGHHDLKVKISMDAGPSGSTVDADLFDEPNGIESVVTITNKLFIAQDIHIAQQDPINDP